MFGTSRPGANAYRQMSVDTDALAASPHQLIVMLFDGALRALDTAAAQMQAGDIEGKGRSLSKAIEIVGSGLAASLDLKAGGEIAANLASLYDYVIRELVAANLRNDADTLDRARQLLAQMRASWVEIGGVAAPQGAHA
ncbi:MAG: flagellar export chaperone FliS [Burkholderiaceae bacterium]|nr:flagellar export chaperone FliS [Burkholderiaceae bacterium]